MSLVNKPVDGVDLKSDHPSLKYIYRKKHEVDINL